MMLLLLLLRRRRRPIHSCSSRQAMIIAEAVPLLSHHTGDNNGGYLVYTVCVFCMYGYEFLSGGKDSGVELCMPFRVFDYYPR